MKFLIGLSILLAASLAFVIYTWQWKLMFFPNPSQFKFADCAEMTRLAAFPKQSEGVRYYERKLDQSFGSLVYFQGNAGSACDRAYFLNQLEDLPYDFYFFEYPGYGGDTSVPGEKIILENAMMFIENLNLVEPVVFFGESLGTGVATYLAAYSKRKPAGLILQAPYTSFEELAQRHYHRFFGFLVRHKFRADLWARDVSEDTAVLMIAAEEDEIIPFDISQKQLNNFKGKKLSVVFKNATHNSMSWDGAEKFWDSIASFLEQTLMNRGQERNENQE